MRAIARLLNSLPRDAREELRDYAGHLLREETEEADRGEGVGRTRERVRSFNAFGIAIPVVLVGAVLMALFPPIGVLLLVVGAGLFGWGILAALWGR
ncbi:MAG: hypothetical protein KatS3mg076_0324 [Candidatus Binatia bacterium]|nr:MAG: hypothetical protein KatS3mg076_0324 [Candidatus Binatia bacterium]